MIVGAARTGRLGSLVVTDPTAMIPKLVAGRRRRWTGLFVSASVVIGAIWVAAPSARADTFCDLSPTSEGVGIDFGQPMATIRSSASARLPFFQGVGKLLPADAPKSVRSLLASDALLVAKAAKVTTTNEAILLARRSVALSSSASGRAAVKWIAKKCSPPDTIETVYVGADAKAPKTATLPTRPANPARSAAAPSSPAPAGTFDPCSVITRQDATAALGTDPGAGDSTPTPAGGQCQYATDVGAINLNVVKGPSTLGKTAKDAVLRMNESALGQKATDTKGDVIYDTLPGIADGAFVIGHGSNPGKFSAASMAFYAGDTLVTIFLTLDPATLSPVTQVTNLAKAVALQLPR